MLADVQNLLGMYLIPFCLIILLAVLLCVLGNRDGDDPAVLDHQPEPVPPPVAAEPEQPPLILVVDDSAVARVKLSRLFEGAGLRVQQARDGLEALSLLEQQPVSVMITDLEMPNMDGFDLIASVLGSIKTENIPIIAITGNDELQAKIQDIQGLFGIFKKPWNDRALLKRVEALIAVRASV